MSIQTPRSHKSDETKEKVGQIKQQINNTSANMELAEEIIAQSPDDTTAKVYREQNKRRQQALSDAKNELSDINSPKTNKQQFK